MRCFRNKIVLCVWVTILCICGLDGCGRDVGSFMLSTSRHAITLTRVTPYFWSSSYEISVVLANLPRCQRSYNLLDVTMDHPFVASLYLMGPQTLLLKIDEHAYALNHVLCKVEAVEARVSSSFIKIGDFVPASSRGGCLEFKTVTSSRL